MLPADAYVPPANAYWSVLQTPQSIGLDQQARLDLAVQILQDAGWTWRSMPAWDAEHATVIPGRDPRLPNGDLLPPLTILSPAPAYDPQSATFNLWVAEWLRDLGLTVQSELTTPESLWEQILIGGIDFDLYILGWELTPYPDYLCAFFDSRNDTFTTGGYNTTGFANPDLDRLCGQLATVTDFETAHTILAQIQAILLAERPYLPLFYPQVLDRFSSQVQLPFSESVGGVAAASGFQSAVQIFNP